MPRDHYLPRRPARPGALHAAPPPSQSPTHAVVTGRHQSANGYRVDVAALVREDREPAVSIRIIGPDGTRVQRLFLSPPMWSAVEEAIGLCRQHVDTVHADAPTSASTTRTTTAPSRASTTTGSEPATKGSEK